MGGRESQVQSPEGRALVLYTPYVTSGILRIHR